MSAHFDHIRGEGEAGACDSLQSKLSMGETEGERARMPQGHFFVHCVYSGRREPYGTPFLPPAGGANKKKMQIP